MSGGVSLTEFIARGGRVAVYVPDPAHGSEITVEWKENAHAVDRTLVLAAGYECHRSSSPVLALGRAFSSAGGSADASRRWDIFPAMWCRLSVVMQPVTKATVSTDTYTCAPVLKELARGSTRYRK
jgi:hypothetical protein